MKINIIVTVITISLGFISLVSGMSESEVIHRYIDSDRGNNLGELNDCRDLANPCKTITHALNRAKKTTDSGDTRRNILHVAPRNYDSSMERFPLMIEISVTLMADSSDPKKTVVIDAGGAEAAIFITPGGSGTTIQGLTIQGANLAATRKEAKTDCDNFLAEGKAPLSAGLLIGGKPNEVAKDIKVINNVVTNNRIGMFLCHSTQLWIEGNRIQSNTGEGIVLAASSDNTLLNNVVDSNKDSGREACCDGISVLAFQGGENASERNRLFSNIIMKNGVGIFSSNSTDLELGNQEKPGNTMIDNASEGIRIKCKTEQLQPCKATLEKNFARNNGSGIVLQGSFHDTMLRSNTAANNGEAGFDLSGSQYTMEGNTATQNGVGIRVQGTGNQFRGNTVSSNRIGISIQGSTEDSTQAEENNTVNENSVSSNSCVGIELVGSKFNHFRGNLVSQNGKGSNCDEPFRRGGFVFRDSQLVATLTSDSNVLFRNIILENLNGISMTDQSQLNHVKCNDILNNQVHGIVLSGVTHDNHFNRNNIVGNKVFGLRNFTDEVVDARENWWGNNRGPSMGDKKAGDKVLGPTDTSNFRIERISINRCSLEDLP